MSSGDTTEIVPPGEQTATAGLPTTPNSKPKLRLTNKRKPSDLNGEITSEGNNGSESRNHEVEEVPRKSPKKASVKLPKLAPKTLLNGDSTSEQVAAGSTESVAVDSKKRKANDERVQNGSATTDHAEPPSKARKKAAPKEKATDQGPPKDNSPEEQNLATQPEERSAEMPKKRKAENQIKETLDSPKDSVTESDVPPAKKPKRVSPRAKKPSPKQLAADAENKRKAATKNMPPPPPPPALITQEVANKVKQVRQFIENKHNDYSRLDRDLEHKHLISVPRSSLISAVIRMRVHYQMTQSKEEAIHGVEEAVVVKRFEQEIGSKSDVDWVVIDATRTSKFEGGIHEKIARHGLDHVNLLETELEIFKKDHLKREGLLDDAKEVAWDGDRFLRTFNSIWKNLGFEEDDEGEAERMDPPSLREEKEVGRNGVGVAPPIQLV